MHHSLKEILSFTTKNLMIKCLKQLVIDYNNTKLFQILRVKSCSHILVVHLTNKRWHGNKKVDVIFSLQVFIHVPFMIDDKMMCHYIHNMIIKLLYNDSKMTINISSHRKNYDM